MSQNVVDIDVDLIDDSPTNPRQFYSDESIQEMAHSITEVGIVQPITVRSKSDGRWEAVVGHRRKRGAIQAGIQKVPCIVADHLTDEAVREVQLIENAQREDIHPMEEAVAFDQLMSDHGFTVDKISSRVGKTEQYVRSRMRLLALTKQNQVLFINGRLELGHALIVARLTDKQEQDEAGRFAAYGWNGPSKSLAQLEKEAKEDEKEGELTEPQSLQQTRSQVERMMRNIDEMPWDPADADLLPKAGPCTTCPKLTGNEAQSALFGVDVKTEGRCLDRGCYSQKMDALWKKVSAEHKKIGGKVLSKKDAKKTFAHSIIAYDAGVIDLSDRPYMNGLNDRKSMLDIIEPDPKDVILARDPSGRVRYLYDSKKANSILKKKRSASGTGKLTDKEKKDRKKKRRHNETIDTVRGVIEISTRIMLGDPEFREHVRTVPREKKLIAIAAMLLEADFYGRVAMSLLYAGEDYEPIRDGKAVIQQMVEDMKVNKLDPLDVILRFAVARYRGHQEVTEAFEIACSELEVPVHELMDKNLALLKEKWDEQDERAKKRASKSKNGSSKKGSSKKKGSSTKASKSKSKPKGDDDEPPTPGPEAA